MSHTEGFLSGDLSASIAGIRRDFAPWFDVARSFNELGMRVLTSVTPDTTSNQQLIGAALYGRVLTSFQAAYLLAERGMLADARTIVRAAAETAIVLSAVAKDATVCDRLVDRHFWHHRTLRNAWLADPQAVAEMGPEEVDAIKAAVADAEAVHPAVAQIKGDPVALATLAQKANVVALYNAVYRSTSGDAAHTSIDALNRHIRSDAQGNIQGLKFGPEVSDLPMTLFNAISTMAHALQAESELFALTQFGEDVGKCMSAWKNLGVPGEFKPPT